ncbi:MAG: hypothetical protein EBT15_09045 [Betaproteobacteria bacterium]|nr:hypothetical protein [Betaproteobacteria bacterium]
MALVTAAVLLCLIVWLLVVMALFLNAPFAPVALTVSQIRSNPTMADVLVYKVSVGPVVDADVVERQLVVAINGTNPVDEFKVFPADTTELGEISVPQGASVLLTLVDVDDAGNRSEPAVLEFVAEDTLPPAQPGAFGVTLVREEKNEEPTA